MYYQNLMFVSLEIIFLFCSFPKICLIFCISPDFRNPEISLIIGEQNPKIQLLRILVIFFGCPIEIDQDIFGNFITLKIKRSPEI